MKKENERQATGLTFTEVWPDVSKRVTEVLTSFVPSNCLLCLNRHSFDWNDGGKGARE